jgi:hypothetical protein
MEEQNDQEELIYQTKEPELTDEIFRRMNEIDDFTDNDEII